MPTGTAILKRTLSLALVIVIAMSCVPFGAFAAGGCENGTGHTYQNSFCTVCGAENPVPPSSIADGLAVTISSEHYVSVSNSRAEKLACGPALVSLGDGRFAVAYLADEIGTVETEASCVAEGSYDMAVYCGTCAAELERSTNIIKATGHSWDDGTVTTQPGEYTEGVKTYKCANCSETKTEAIPALGHTHKYTSAITAPSCAEQGYTTYTCPCGHSYTGDNVPAVGHKWTEGELKLRPTTVESGLVGFVCTVCGESREETAAMIPVPGFEDVPEGAWYYEPVAWAAHEDITTGVSESLFAPNAPCTRAQIVTFLWRATDPIL